MLSRCSITAQELWLTGKNKQKGESMLIDTKKGSIEVADITHKKRRELYLEVKTVFDSNDIESLHKLQDKFGVIAFGSEDKFSKAMGKYSAVEEDEILVSIIMHYMGMQSGNMTGD